jgi:AcrR family transcriptional regulator
MERDPDLRVVRTQQMIKAAFFEMIEKIGFENITVQNLTRKAAINRSTFYLHYTDKYDLLNKLETEVLNGVKGILATLDFDTILKSADGSEPYPHIVKIMNFVKENERFYTLILSSKGDPAFIAKVGELIRSVMSGIIKENNIINKLKVPANYVIAMLIATITSFLSEWTRTGMRESPYELACIFTDVIRHIPYSLLNQSPDAPQN